MGSRILVVADAPEAERLAGWLREEGLESVAFGDGSDETLTEFARDPADVVVLAAGLATGDALAFSGALRAEGGEASAIVLIGEDSGPVRTALDAGDFGAERFLRRPVARAALVWSVKSCLGDEQRPAGSAGGPTSPRKRKRATTEADSPETLALRLEQATALAFAEAAEESLDRALAPEPMPDVHAAPAAGAEPPVWREPTQIIPGAPATPSPSAAAHEPVSGPPSLDGPRGGTFVSELRKHMSLVEARLFGGEVTPLASDDDPLHDIDLDAFGMLTQPGLSIEATDPLEAPMPAQILAPAAAASPPALTPTPTPGGSLRAGVDLADEDVASLFARLARERFTGQADFRRGDTEKRVTVEDGRAVFATSNLPHDRMGDLLLREGKITRAQHARARELAESAGRRLGEVLVELGHLKRRELLPAVRRHVEDIVYSLYGWEHGSCVLHAGSPLRDEKIRLAAHPSAVVIEGIRRKYGGERLRRLVGPPQTVLVPVDPAELAGALADAELGTDERRLAEAFDGRRTLAEIVAGLGRDSPPAASGGELALYALAHALVALRLARRASPGREGTEPGYAEVIAPPSTITGAAELQVDRDRVLAKHAHVVEADYFTVLGLRPDASGFEIRRAWESARRDFAAEGFPAELQRELVGELAEIALVLDEALRVLRDDRVRTAYAAHLPDVADLSDLSEHSDLTSKRE